MKEWNANLTTLRRVSMREQLTCSRLFTSDKAVLKHSYPNLYK
jgi:hypothetical protein